MPHTAEPKRPTKSFEHWLALAKETVVREWLLEIVPPRRQIIIRVRFGKPWVSSNIISQQCYRGSEYGHTDWSIYDIVGKFGGSQPILI